MLVPSCDAASVVHGALAPGDPRRITVSGVPGAVADAVRIIEDIIRETEIKGGGGGGGGTRMGSGGGGGGGQNHLEIPVMVPPEMIGRVIGRGGETIRRLQEVRRCNLKRRNPCSKRLGLST